MTGSEISVSGGAGGLEADLADLAALGRNSTDLAEMLAATSLTCHGMLVDPDVLASAVLDPAGVARFEAALLEALDGPGGLSALAVRFAARAATLQAAALAYEAADAALAEMADTLDWAIGTIPGLFVTTVLAEVAAELLSDPEGAADALGELIEDPERWVTEHPGLVDSVVNKAPGLLGGLSLLGGGDVRAAAALLGNLWPDGRPVVTRRPDDVRQGVLQPPRNVTDLLTALDLRNRSAAERDTDQVSVRVITHADGTRAFVVDIPGTQDWSPPGLSPNRAPNDLGTNVRVLGGDVTTRQEAIAMALHRAGAGPTDPVMLVGHSQGGMVAAQAAHDSGTAAFPYDVRSVVTAGSPVARAGIPESVQVLALENAHDIVPHLDGRSNDDDPNVTTVTFDRQKGSVGENHGISTAYRYGAEQVDRSDDPSIAHFRAASSPFFVEPGESATVRAQVFELEQR
ncbi:alpha/beta hydrolase [Blastococcus sp. TF02A_35]|uniref:esterase/lipase family protein n=1 Tax=Blastococcus sp. TF02A-35 TaxID=2559612 RepID=UPI0010743689|nr:alpha/beta hydrolase [Blastococcus sp. TF02A_35]TFV51883.1 alpha/beta hydrolase [Blastococcus sp. TF02A_35]